MSDIIAPIDYAKIREGFRSVVREELKPTPTTVTQNLANASIAAGGSVNIDMSNLDGFSAIAVSVRATYATTAAAGARVRWLYSPDGVNFDSPEDAVAETNYVDLTFAAGATRQKTILIPILAPSVRIQIVNLDTAAAVTVSAWSWLLR